MNTTIGGGWLGADLAREVDRHRVAIPEATTEELFSLADSIRSHGDELDPLMRRTPNSSETRSLVAEVTRRLAAEPGFVVLTGFPVNGRPEVVETAYQLFGQLIGPAVSQTRDDTFLGRVEDRGADISEPVQRGHRSAEALPFHADRADVVGLLCVRPAAQGGLSRIASSKKLHDTVLDERPDLLPVLYRTFPQDQRGEQRPGRPPWCELPVFSLADGDFAARYVRRFIASSQRHVGAPRLTAQQLAAMDAIDSILERPGFALEMNLRSGEIQMINNFHVLHARTAFSDGCGSPAGRVEGAV